MKELRYRKIDAFTLGKSLGNPAACMYNLVVESSFLMAQKEIVIETNKKGSLTVYNEIQTQDSVYITSPIPQYIETNLDKKLIAESLNINTGQISDTLPLDIFDAGLRTLIIPISTLNDETSIFPNEQSIAHTRVFAPKFGYLEDPATGSGNSAFGYYMLKNNLWNGKSASVEQGGTDRIICAGKCFQVQYS